MPSAWLFLSACAFVAASLALVVTLVVFWMIWRKLDPVLMEALGHARDVSQTASKTLGDVADTIGVVESRLTNSLGKAEEAGHDARRQALGLGGVVAGALVVAQLIGRFRRRSRRR